MVHLHVVRRLVILLVAHYMIGMRLNSLHGGVLHTDAVSALDNWFEPGDQTGFL